MFETNCVWHCYVPAVIVSILSEVILPLLMLLTLVKKYHKREKSVLNINYHYTLFEYFTESNARFGTKEFSVP